MKKISFNRKFIIILFLFMLLVFIFFWIVIMPILRFNLNYNIPKNMTAEETLRYYFECLDSNNPGKANKLLVNPTLDIYDYSTGSISISSINKLETIIESSNEFPKSEYFTVKFSYCSFISYSFDEHTQFHLKKESKDSDWKIESCGFMLDEPIFKHP